MFAFIKALFLGAFLSAIVSLFVGSAGSTGGLLNVHGGLVAGMHLYWSWTLFLIGTGLAFGILWLME